MYFFPTYVDYYEDSGAIYVHSQLRQNKVKLSEPEIIEEFRRLVRGGGCLEISTELSRFLHDQEMLVDEQELESAVTELRNILKETLLLTVMPTEGCNFRCPYCYEDHAPISMTRRMLDQIHVYIAEQSSNFKRISIGWFGGEPTLCKDVILETSELVQKLQKKNGFQFVSHMTTNGYLLNLDSFQQYYSAGITSYQITLDGWDHDKTRPHVTGKGTLQRILDNLTSISSLPRNEYDYHITLRHNILPGDEDFTWYDHLHSLFGTDDRFSILVRPVCDWGGEGVRSMDILHGESRNTLMKKHLDYLREKGMAFENGSKGILSMACYANYPHSMVFRANGKIEKCTVCLDHPKNLLGYLDFEHGVVLDEEINALWADTTLKKECYHCPDLLSCLNMQCKMSAIISDENKTGTFCQRSSFL